MLTAFKITLIVLIIISLLFAFDPKGSKDSKLNASLLCVFGIIAFIVSSLVL